MNDKLTETNGTCELSSFLQDTTNKKKTVIRVINLNNPEFINLQIDNGWTYVSGGSRGILLYRISANNYKAFDRHCPYNPSSSCGLVSVDVTNLVGIDDCCGSRFLLSSGQVTQGPATRPLKEYKTTYDGSTLSVFN